MKRIEAEESSRLRAASINPSGKSRRLCHSALNGAWILALTLALASESQAQTTVCGAVVGQTWTKANSPYLVTCDLTVSTLTIQPGVQVIFQANYKMDVQAG